MNPGPLAQGITEELLVGPLAGLALALVIIGLFQTAKILSSKTVLKEDFDKIVEINATQAEGIRTLTGAVNELVVAVRALQRNGGL